MRVLFVGSLDRTTAYKALPDLLEAMRRVRRVHPGATLEVAGDGDARSAHEQLAARLGIAGAVRFRGRLTGRDEIADAYRGAGIVATRPTTTASRRSSSRRWPAGGRSWPRSSAASRRS